MDALQAGLSELVGQFQSISQELIAEKENCERLSTQFAAEKRRLEEEEQKIGKEKEAFEKERQVNI